MSFKKTALPIFLATVWISLSEFLRNEFLFKEYWLEHYDLLGLDYPDEPLNGVIWVVWSLLFAIFLFQLGKKFSWFEMMFTGWLAAFLMMWVSLGNLEVLPFNLLIWAFPLSILETGVAAFIFKQFLK
jgi:hypothetical protein